jgi:alkylation response protein AidB-like acyl-CoA dehydrogenase
VNGLLDATAAACPDEAIARALETAAQVADICAALAPGTDDARAFPVEAFERIRAAGLLAAPLPRAAGGLGLDGSPATMLPLLLLLKTIGRGDLSVGRLYEGHVNALQLIQTFGTRAQVARWAAHARERGLLFGVWNTEAGDGVQIRPLGHGRYRLAGAKTFASGAGYVARPIVPGALPDGGWQMAVVPMDAVAARIDPSWWNPLGMRASASYKVDFDGVEIGDDDLLGAPGDYHCQPWFAGGAVRFAAVQLGGAEALLAATRDYLRALERAGDPYQRARIGEAAILIESGNLWLRGAAGVVELGPDAGQSGDSATRVTYANMTRLAIERICLDVLRLAERSLGARGLLQPHPAERIIRDLTLYLRQPAPDAVLASVGERARESPGRRGMHPVDVRG